MANHEAKVLELMAEQSGGGVSEINKESTLEDNGLDSLDAVELVMALEEEFSIEIPDDDAEEFNTVQEVIDYINEHAN